jgi:hypothetical protein
MNHYDDTSPKSAEVRHDRNKEYDIQHSLLEMVMMTVILLYHKEGGCIVFSTVFVESLEQEQITSGWIISPCC